ncbi:MAG: four helix bundle protein, partial [Saprospiraceae bacterium]|nr:four helix bundle protein [Saprospiraceae bacterium]
NVAEGFERGSNGEFRSFLGYAKGSSGELRSQLMRSADRQFITPEELKLVGSKVMQFSKQTKALICTLEKAHTVDFVSRGEESGTGTYSSGTCTCTCTP